MGLLSSFGSDQLGFVTAETPGWAQTAGQMTTGYAASVIGCDAEAGIERTLSLDESPDGRPGVSLLFFAFSRDALQKALVNRVAQCILTCPTTACYNGLGRVARRHCGRVTSVEGVDVRAHCCYRV
jgi:formylmethanofuran--tetrahydromethanopterin N-formyltransferase